MERMWLTPRELAETYELSYREALMLAKSGKLAGYWRGNRYRFNAVDARRAFEDGTIAAVLTTKQSQAI